MKCEMCGKIITAESAVNHVVNHHHGARKHDSTDQDLQLQLDVLHSDEEGKFTLKFTNQTQLTFAQILSHFSQYSEETPTIQI